MRHPLAFASGIILLAGLGLFAAWQAGGNGPSRGEAEKRKWVAGENVDLSKRSQAEENARTKVRTRNSRMKPTKEETRRLVMNTVIPRLDLPEQSIAARVRELNRLLRKCGVDPHDLTVSIEPDDAKRERPISELSIPELRVRNIPIFAALQFMTDRTIPQFRIMEGQVEFWNYHYMPEQLLYIEKCKVLEELERRISENPEGNGEALEEWKKLQEEVHGHTFDKSFQITPQPSIGMDPFAEQ